MQRCDRVSNRKNGAPPQAAFALTMHRPLVIPHACCPPRPRRGSTTGPLASSPPGDRS
ncbi:hypothetical protein BS78_06G027000 [Paspalum vaginatum]|nr:hypothetical protein BS78_06G027000 [Paspalum vaginatum]